MEEIGVDWVSRDNSGRLECLDERAQIAFWEAHERKIGAGEIAFIGVFVDFFPDLGEMGGDETIAPLEKGGGMRCGEQAGVCDTSLRTHCIKGEGEVFRSRVMPFAEGCGNDKNAWFLGHR